ncbi:MAG: hypothetical protein ACRECY_00600 [Phyllobacterium sp.]
MPEWTLFDHERNLGLFTGADAVFTQKIRPLAALFDTLRLCLDEYQNAANKADKSERWRRAEAIHREIMTIWRLSFLEARGAVDRHLAEMGLNGSTPEHDSLQEAVRGTCRPSTDMALLLLRFDDMRPTQS